MTALSEYLKEFLKKPEIKQALNEDNFKYIYEAINKTRCSLTEFTELMLEMGDNPLDYLTEIPDYFLCRSTLSHFDIPNHIKVIGSKSFIGCVLTKIDLPTALTRIDAGAFCGCSKLTAVNFAKCSKLESINQWAFEYCSNLEEIDLSNCKNLTRISDSAFSQCTSLNKIVLPNSLTSIDKYAFYNCSGLTNIVIPNSVTSIGIDAFSRCTGLKKIILPKKFENETQWRNELPEDVEVEYC